MGGVTREGRLRKKKREEEKGKGRRRWIVETWRERESEIKNRGV